MSNDVISGDGMGGVHDQAVGTASGKWYDVVVVGGGAAGLSGALALARARRSVLVIDAGKPRNAPAAHVHNYLTRDGTPPSELFRLGRAEVTGYGGEVISGTVARIERRDSEDERSGFRVGLTDNTSVYARRLLVATGIVDELPDVPGVRERWGRDVLHCPYCHGWEIQDQAIGILGTGPMAVHGALLFRQWSADVVLFQHNAPPLSEEQREQLTARGITIIDGEVATLEVSDDRLAGVRLRTGELIPRQAVVVSPRFTAHAEVFRTLGLETTEREVMGHVLGTYIAVDATGATSVPRVWAAGNVADPFGQVIAAASAGLMAGAAINYNLIEEETAQAVAAFRAQREAMREPLLGETRQRALQRNTNDELHIDAEASEGQRFWEQHYRSHQGVWSGRPNAVLADFATSLPSGSALDLGCSEGGDAIWLAQRGWQVTAVDVSATALRRATAQATGAGVADRIDFQQHDLAYSFPTGSFDLVSALYLQSPIALPRTQILQAAASAVAPGGLLLVVEHASTAPWSWNQDPHQRFPPPEELLATLDLDPTQWHTEFLGAPTRQAEGPSGMTAEVADNIIAVRRQRQ